MHQTYDILAIYQHSWNPGRGVKALCTRRAALWRKIIECVNHIPYTHFLVIAGDFNSPFQQHPPFVQTFDPKFDKASQTDKEVFQQMIQDLQLLALPAGNWKPTFVHGNHATRIDFILIRRQQRRASMDSHLVQDFDRNFGIIGPHH